MTSKSKSKGNSFEREVAKFLSDTYEDSFVRVPNSGAYIGGSNVHRKQSLNENQAKSFKGDIVGPDSWKFFNAECKNYGEFPFHLVLTGECKLLNEWLDQLMAVAEPDDLNILFVKVSRKGKFVCVQTKHTWVTDQFLYYSSKAHKDWLIIEFDHFWKYNSNLVKTYSGSSDTTSISQIKTENLLPQLKIN